MYILSPKRGQKLGKIQFKYLVCCFLVSFLFFGNACGKSINKEEQETASKTEQRREQSIFELSEQEKREIVDSSAGELESTDAHQDFEPTDEENVFEKEVLEDASEPAIPESLVEAHTEKSISSKPWLKSITGSPKVLGGGIALDSQGSILITGAFRRTISFGSMTLTAQQNYDTFVAKLDHTGKWLWAKHVGYSNARFIVGTAGITLDAKDNILLTGMFHGTANFGNISLASKGGTKIANLFVAKLDPSGKWLWAKRAGSIEGGSGRGITVDTKNNVLVTGFFTGRTDFGSTTLVSKGGSNLFVAKLDPSGKWLWAKRAGSSHRILGNNGNGIATDKQDNVFVTGRFSVIADFGSTTLTAKGAGQQNIFVAKLDHAGKWIWAKRAGNGIGNSNIGMGIAVDQQGTVLVTGVFNKASDFGSTTLTSKGNLNIFVAKLDTTGKWIWAKRAGTSGFELNRNYSNVAPSMGVDGQGSIFITGNFQGTADFGKTTLTAKVGYNMFVAKVDQNGKYLWAKRAGSSGEDGVTGISIDQRGSLFLTGKFSKTADFGSKTITAKEYHDLFVAKLRSPPSW